MNTVISFWKEIKSIRLDELNNRKTVEIDLIKLKHKIERLQFLIYISISEGRSLQTKDLIIRIKKLKTEYSKMHLIYLKFYLKECVEQEFFLKKIKKQDSIYFKKIIEKKSKILNKLKIIRKE